MIMFQVTGADVHTREIMLSFQLPGNPSCINLVGPKAVIHYVVHWLGQLLWWLLFCLWDPWIWHLPFSYCWLMLQALQSALDQSHLFGHSWTFLSTHIHFSEKACSPRSKHINIGIAALSVPSAHKICTIDLCSALVQTKSGVAIYLV